MTCIRSACAPTCILWGVICVKFNGHNVHLNLQHGCIYLNSQNAIMHAQPVKICTTCQNACTTCQNAGTTCILSTCMHNLSTCMHNLSTCMHNLSTCMHNMHTVNMHAQHAYCQHACTTCMHNMHAQHACTTCILSTCMRNIHARSCMRKRELFARPQAELQRGERSTTCCVRAILFWRLVM